MANDDLVTRLREHSLGCDCLDAEILLMAAADEIERLCAEVNKWEGAAERFAESHPQFEAFRYYFKARQSEQG